MLWLLVLVHLLRGVAGVMEPREPATVAAAPKPLVAAWPDDEGAGVRDFARAYLTFTPADPDASADAVRVFVAPVARIVRVDDSRALVTVASAATGGTRYLTVPIARDARGGLVVSDLPSLAAPPARASVPVSSWESVPGSTSSPSRDGWARA